MVPRISPLTCSLPVGLVTPIPTLPSYFKNKEVLYTCDELVTSNARPAPRLEAESESITLRILAELSIP